MSNVLVAVRVRPMNLREEEQEAKVAVKIDSSTIQVTNFKVPGYQDHDSRARTRHFSFDFCYWTAEKTAPNYASQAMIYQDLGIKVLEAIFTGFNACVLAYGQSGTGKTYTMMGHNDDLGLIPRICQGLFERIAQLKEKNLNFRTEISFLEIYNEKVSDLLRTRCHFKRPVKQCLRVREHPKTGPCVQNLSKHPVTDYNSTIALLEKGIQNRNIAATKMHDHSSRSHAIFTIMFTQVRLDTDLPSEIVSKIQLVDLAGSERAGINTSKIRLKEGANINKSLVALGSVICTLADKSMSQYNVTSTTTYRGHSRRGSGGGLSVGGQSPFVPYRDSVLTWLLKDSLGGNSKTIMVATISPASSAFQETVNTLRYAQRAKCIVNKPIVNEDPKVKLIRELKLEVDRLRKLLANAQKAIGNMLVTDMINKNQDKAEELTRVWIEKWKEFRQQDLTCGTCTHKFHSENQLDNDNDFQLLPSVEYNISEEHVQTVYKDRINNRTYSNLCRQCERPLDLSPTETTEEQFRHNSESDSSGFSNSKANDTCEDEDGWSNADEFCYVNHKPGFDSPLEDEDTQELERQLSPITENISTLSEANEIFLATSDTELTLDSDCCKSDLLELSDNLPFASTHAHEIDWSEFKIPNRVFDYSTSDLDIEQDSLDDSPSCLPAKASSSITDSINQPLIKDLGQCQPVELWTSSSCQQQSAQFASIQPHTLTIEAKLWRSISSIHLANPIEDSPVFTLHNKREPKVPQVLETSDVPFQWLDSLTSDEEHRNKYETSRNSSIKRKNKIPKKRFPSIEQRIQAIKRRKRRKLAIKTRHKINESEEYVNSTKTITNSSDNYSCSPPPLPRPSFLNATTECKQNSRNETISVDDQQNPSHSTSTLTCWRDVVNSQPNEPSIAFDCSSWINCQSWPSCDSLTMVYVGPKWTSEKDNILNSTENIEGVSTRNSEQSTNKVPLIVNNLEMSYQHPNADSHFSHKYCSCKELFRQDTSKHLTECRDYSDSTLTCAEVSTQTDSGIQVDHPDGADCNWSYSTISAHSQAQVLTVNRGIQTEVIRHHIAAQTQPTTNCVGQQTDSVTLSTSTQIDESPSVKWWQSTVNKCGDDSLRSSSPINKNSSSLTTSVTLIDDKEKTEKVLPQVILDDSSNVSDTKTSTSKSNFNHHCGSLCDRGIYVGFHGIDKTLRDVQIKITLGESLDKTNISTHLAAENGSNNDLKTFDDKITQTLEHSSNLKEPQAESDELNLKSMPSVKSKLVSISDKIITDTFENKLADPASCNVNPVQVHISSKKLKDETSAAVNSNLNIGYMRIPETTSTHKVFPRLDKTVSYSSMSNDEYYQLPLPPRYEAISHSTTSRQLSQSLNESKSKDVKCTCEQWMPPSSFIGDSSFVNSNVDDEDINTNLPEEICQLLKECRQVRKKAWHEISLAHQQLRLTTASVLSQNICAVHGNLSASGSQIHPS